MGAARTAGRTGTRGSGRRRRARRRGRGHGHRRCCWGRRRLGRSGRRRRGGAGSGRVVHRADGVSAAVAAARELLMTMLWTANCVLVALRGGGRSIGALGRRQRLPGGQGWLPQSRARAAYGGRCRPRRPRAAGGAGPRPADEQPSDQQQRDRDRGHHPRPPGGAGLRKATVVQLTANRRGARRGPGPHGGGDARALWPSNLRLAPIQHRTPFTGRLASRWLSIRRDRWWGWAGNDPVQTDGALQGAADMTAVLVLGSELGDPFTPAEVHARRRLGAVWLPPALKLPHRATQDTSR